MKPICFDLSLALSRSSFCCSKRRGILHTFHPSPPCSTTEATSPTCRAAGKCASAGGSTRMTTNYSHASGLPTRSVNGKLSEGCGHARLRRGCNKLVPFVARAHRSRMQLRHPIAPATSPPPPTSSSGPRGATSRETRGAMSSRRMRAGIATARAQSESPCGHVVFRVPASTCELQSRWSLACGWVQQVSTV